MARLTALPSLEIIRGLKGIIDFYLWKGLPCARAWPTWRPARQSEASKAAALFFGAVVKSYSLLGHTALEAYREDAAGQPRSARDVFVSGVYGNLHEADMSDFLGLLIECRDFLSALTAILGALDSIDTDELVVNVDESVLPPLAATSTIQTTQLAALQKLDDLQDALQSKHLDRLIVRGQDQVFSFKSRLLSRTTGVVSGPAGYLDSAGPPNGQIWVITASSANDITSPTTAHAYTLHSASDAARIYQSMADYVADQSSFNPQTFIMQFGDYLQCYFSGSLAGDICRIDIVGYNMTLET